MRAGSGNKRRKCTKHAQTRLVMHRVAAVRVEHRAGTGAGGWTEWVLSEDEGVWIWSLKCSSKLLRKVGLVDPRGLRLYDMTRNMEGGCDCVEAACGM